MAVLAAGVQGGGDISATGPGTIGGFLQDLTGKRWGLTCGHVAQAIDLPVTLETTNGGWAANAGTVRHSNFSTLIPQLDAAACNRYVEPAFPSVDAALFEVEPSHNALCAIKSVGKVDATLNRKQLTSGDTLEMYGAVSQLNSWVVGGIWLLHQGGDVRQVLLLFARVRLERTRVAASVPGRIAAALAAAPPARRLRRMAVQTGSGTRGPTLTPGIWSQARAHRTRDLRGRLARTGLKMIAG